MNTLIGAILVLGVSILVHEWGHFIAARLFKVRVDVFSVGFGPRLFGMKRGDTDWRVSAFPLGGYVRMAGQDVTEIDSGDQKPTGAYDELMSKPRWQRAIISAAGPAVNLIFPVLLLGIYYLVVGLPADSFLSKPVVVAGLPTAQLNQPGGLRVGDRVLSIDGTKSPTWEQAQILASKAAAGSRLKLEVDNSGALRQVELTATGNPYGREFGYAPIPPAIGEVAPGTPADHAGLRAGDRVVAVDGQRISYWDQFVDLVRGSGGKTLELEVERGGKQVALAVTPKLGVSEGAEKYYQIGIQRVFDFSYRRVGPLEALQTASSQTVSLVSQTVGVVEKLVSGRVSLKQLQSVVGISRTAGQAVSQGAFAIISFMALISVNLGILNLLPIPILDGGNILLLTAEGIRRRDFSLTFKERFVQVGLVFILVLLAYVMFNDVMRMLPSHS